jgi:hypothetical protein
MEKMEKNNRVEEITNDDDVMICIVGSLIVAVPKVSYSDARKKEVLDRAERFNQENNGEIVRVYNPT